MKKIIFISILTFGGLLFAALQTSVFHGKTNSNITFKTGDIIYQSSDQGQSKAVKLATHSKYSHVGLVIVKESEVFVLEAVQPVQMIPINHWIERSKDKKYCLQRLKDSTDLSKFNTSLDSISNVMIGKNYDLLFEWSDEKLYCSELVWKVYKEVFGIELCDLKQLKDFDLTHPYVKKIMTQRYGKKYPLEQSVVAPEDLYKSNLLITLTE